MAVSNTLRSGDESRITGQMMSELQFGDGRFAGQFEDALGRRRRGCLHNKKVDSGQLPISVCCSDRRRDNLKRVLTMHLGWVRVHDSHL